MKADREDAGALETFAGIFTAQGRIEAFGVSGASKNPPVKPLNVSIACVTHIPKNTGPLWGNMSAWLTTVSSVRSKRLFYEVLSPYQYRAVPTGPNKALRGRACGGGSAAAWALAANK